MDLHMCYERCDAPRDTYCSPAAEIKSAEAASEACCKKLGRLVGQLVELEQKSGSAIVAVDTAHEEHRQRLSKGRGCSV